MRRDCSKVHGWKVQRMPFPAGRACWKGLEESALLCALGGGRGTCRGPSLAKPSGAQGAVGCWVTLAGPAVQAGWRPVHRGLLASSGSALSPPIPRGPRTYYGSPSPRLCALCGRVASPAHAVSPPGRDVCGAVKGLQIAGGEPLCRRDTPELHAKDSTGHGSRPHTPGSVCKPPLGTAPVCSRPRGAPVRHFCPRHVYRGCSQPCCGC